MDKDNIFDITDSSCDTSAKSGLKHVQVVQFDGLDLALGDRLPEVTVAYETFGRLNDARAGSIRAWVPI